MTDDNTPAKKDRAWHSFNGHWLIGQARQHQALQDSQPNAREAFNAGYDAARSEADEVIKAMERAISLLLDTGAPEFAEEALAALKAYREKQK